MKGYSKLLTLLILPGVLLSQTGCSEPRVMDEGLLNQLRQGFKAKGILNVSSKIYEDENHIKESSLIKGQNENIEIILTYTNTDAYTGIDYKLSLVNQDGTKQYLVSDNMYNRSGYLYFNSVGYDNVLSSDFTAYDKDGNNVAYATSVSLNPFTLLKAHDFKGTKDVMTLDSVKSSLIFGDLLYVSEDVPTNVAAKSLTFNVKDNVLEKISGESLPYYKVETHNLTNYFAVFNYSFSFDVSEIGTANARNEIKQEEHKQQNDNLGIALKNFAKLDSYRVNRHFKTPLDPSEETIDVYFDGANKAIYMGVYDSQFGPRPTRPGGGDALLVDSSKDKDNKLNAYMPDEATLNQTPVKFIPSPALADIDNVLEYQDFLLYGLEYISQDVFNINEDGSYSPIPENLRFMASDCFVPFLCQTNEIAGGYIDSFKLYLTSDKQNIDHIVLESKMGSIIGETTITYDQLNSCVIPFDALNNY